MGEVALGVVWPGRIEVLGTGFCIVCTGDVLELPDGARYRAMPAVIVPGAEERLVDRAADELLHEMAGEQVAQRVRLFLDPERSARPHPPLDGERRGLARVDHDPGVTGRGDRPLAGLEFADEEVVPAPESEVRRIRVGLELIEMQVRAGVRAQPAARGVVEDVARLLAAE